jgi:hypothetical protein
VRAYVCVCVCVCVRAREGRVMPSRCCFVVPSVMSVDPTRDAAFM